MAKTTRKVTKPLVDMDNTREEEQREVMRKIIAAGDCPFCKENLGKYHRESFMKEGDYWLLTKNKWPYKNTKVHLMAILKEHAAHLHEIPPEAGRELIELFAWAEQEYDIPGGGWWMRFGDTNYSAGTVNHLHAQFVEPDLEAKDYQPTRVKIGKSPEKLVQARKVAQKE